MSIHVGGGRGNRNCPKYLKAQYDAEPRVASRRVALRGVATRRVVHNFGDHARVYSVQRPHPSHVYSVQYTIIRRELDILVVYWRCI